MPPPLATNPGRDLLRTKTSSSGPGVSKKTGKLNTATAHTPRAKKLLELPDELLLKVFRNFHSVTTIQGSHKYNPKSRYIDNIKSLRLTCHWFNEIASQFLLNFVIVEPTVASLHRLEGIAAHPIMSRQIFGAHVSLATYSPHMADSLYHFNHAVRQLFLVERDRKSIEDYGDEFICHYGLRSRLPPFFVCDEEKSIINERAHALMKSLETTEIHPTYTRWRGETNLQDAFEDYRRRFNEQKRVIETLSFARRVAQALARMPRIKILMLNDKPAIRHLGKVDIWWALLTEDHAKIVQRYIMPSSANTFQREALARSSLDAKFPLKAAVQILTFSAGFGVGIKDLRCRFHVQQSEPQWEDFTRVYTGLRRFGMGLTHADVSILVRWGRAEEEMAEFAQKIVTAMLSVAPLNSLHLRSRDLASRSDSDVFITEVTDSILDRLQPGRLRRLVLNRDVSVSLDTLQKLLIPFKDTEEDSNKPKFHLELDGVHLRTDNRYGWGEALEVFRGCVDNTSIVRDPHGDFPGRSHRYVNDLFSPIHQLQGEETEANSYIRGDPIRNPIIRIVEDWGWQTW
ncbi:hypothetical protein F5Y16DRAFT_397847 [Xylariaceae sp. FL0255]|nr:hypothetical protein F5Y16DRAFT_397847 [Xylariaceae sp. FL0255]